jgi:hypothetical protein
MLAVTSNQFRQRCSAASYCLRGSYLFGSCYPHDGGDTFFRNVGSYKSRMAQYPRRLAPHTSLGFLNNIWRNPQILASDLL